MMVRERTTYVVQMYLNLVIEFTKWEPYENQQAFIEYGEL